MATPLTFMGLSIIFNQILPEPVARPLSYNEMPASGGRQARTCPAREFILNNIYTSSPDLFQGLISSYGIILSQRCRNMSGKRYFKQPSSIFPQSQALQDRQACFYRSGSICPPSSFYLYEGTLCRP